MALVGARAEFMGVFDDDDENEVQVLAEKVLSDLRALVKETPLKNPETATLSGTTITLSEAAGKSLRIIVIAPNDFQLEYDLGTGGPVQRQVGGQMRPPNVRVSQAEMVRRVKAWRNNTWHLLHAGE
jgi:hypothetical protein